MKRGLISLALVTACIAIPVSVLAQKQPQDNWWLEKSWLHGMALEPYYSYGYGLAVDSTGRVFVANGNGVLVYNEAGVSQAFWSVSAARGIATDPTSNLVYVCVANTISNQVRVYSTNGALVRQWGSGGAGVAQLDRPYGLCVTTNLDVYIADTYNHRIQVYNATGGFVRQWGGFGALPGEFKYPTDVAVASDGSVQVADYGNYRVQRFSATSSSNATNSFLRQYQLSSWNPIRLLNGSDGLMYACETYNTRTWRLFSGQSELLGILEWFPKTYADGSFVNGYAHAMSLDAQRMYLLTEREIRVYRRGYHTITTNALPIPVVLVATQRSEKIDIAYRVDDADDATVQVAVGAFVDGRRDLRALVMVTNLVDGTAGNVGTNIATGVPHQLTWDTTDWRTNAANIKLDILAKDRRGLMDFHFLTLSNAAQPELKISRTPLTQDDFLQLWTWLLLTGSTNLTLVNGEVRDTGNTNLLYAYTVGTNTFTTDAGRTNLFTLLNVREATSNELIRAKLGTTPTNFPAVLQWTPRVRVGDLPDKVNAYNFDTGRFVTNNIYANPTNVWWVVQP